MKISKHIIGPISKFILNNFGYTVVSWPEAPNSAGFYRPRVSFEGKESNNIAIMLVDDNTLYIQDHAGKINSRAFYDLREFKEIQSTDVPKELEEKLRKVLEKSNADREKEFIDEIYKTTARTAEELFKEFRDTVTKAKVSKNHKAIRNKKIIPKSCIALDSNKIMVPYFKNTNLDIAGIQVRSPSAKWAIKGSSTSSAFCILNWGEKDPVFNQVNVLVSESWSTACSIAEVRPNDMVVATASLNQVANVCRLFDETDKRVVAVIDKTEDNKPQDMITKEIKKLTYYNIPYVQPDFKYIGSTDFNDIRVKHGLTTLDTEMKLELAYVLPIGPQVYSADGLMFKLLTPLGDKVVEIRGDRLTPAVRGSIAGRPYWSALEKIWRNVLPEKKEEISEEADKEFARKYEAEFREKVFQHFTKEARRAKQNSLKRMGIYKDNGGYVLNSGCASLFEKDNKIFPVINMKPLGNHTYERQGDASIEYDERRDPPFDAIMLKNLAKHWYTLLGETKKAHLTLKAILGFTAQAAYASFSDYRAHIWITGGSGAGKSRVVGDLAIRLTEGLSLSYIGATESGISQDVRNQAKVDTEGSTLVRCDELGMDTEKKARVATELIMTARNMASQTDIELAAKGSSDGVSQKYNSKFAFLFSSTTHCLRDIQDLSRFIIEDLPSPKGNMTPHTYDEYYKAIKEAAKPFQVLLLKEAHNYTKHVDLCFNYIDKLCKTYKNSELAQKKRTLTAIVAGYSIIIKRVKNLQSEKACEDAYHQLYDWLQDELEEYMEQTESSNDLMDRFGRCIVKHANLTKPIFYFLFDEDEAKDFKLLYGISVTKQDDQYYLNIEKFKNKASDFLKSSQCLTKIYNLPSILKDYASQGLVEEKRLGKQKDGRRPVIYRIRVPKEYHEKYTEEEVADGVFEAFPTESS